MSFVTKEERDADRISISIANDKIDTNNANAKTLGTYKSKKLLSKLVLEGLIAENSREKDTLAKIDRVF